MQVRLCVLLMVLLASSMALASAKESIKAEPSEFPARRAQIEKALSDPERYSELTRTQREELIRALDRMEKTLAGVASVASLDTNAQVQLMNDQELVNSMLTQGAEESRLVCRSEVKTGSHRKTTTCLTVAEIRRAREQSMHRLRQTQRSYMARPPGEQ